MIKAFFLRLIAVYFLLYFFPFYQSSHQDLITWIARRIFGFSDEFQLLNVGSGDRLFDYYAVFANFSIAGAVGLIWTGIDRGRLHNEFTKKGLYLGLRVALATVMISYGFIKIIPPFQFQAPSLVRLMSTYGNSSPMGLLWTFMGSSQNYMNFGGMAEVIGGILLLLPRVHLLGALIVFGVSLNVLVLNLSYDVPVKIYSFHLMLVSLVLISYHLKELFSFFVLQNQVSLKLKTQCFERDFLNKGVNVGLFLFGIFYVWQCLGWLNVKEESPKVPMYGIWYIGDVTGTENFPWTHLIFERQDLLAVKNRDGTIEYIKIEEVVEHKSLILNKKEPEGTIAFEIEDLTDGFKKFKTEWAGKPISFMVHKVDVSKFLLLSRGFHFVSESPFNR